MSGQSWSGFSSHCQVNPNDGASHRTNRESFNASVSQRDGYVLTQSYGEDAAELLALEFPSGIGDESNSPLWHTH